MEGMWWCWVTLPRGALLLSGLVMAWINSFNQFILPHAGPTAHMSLDINSTLPTASGSNAMLYTALWVVVIAVLGMEAPVYACLCVCVCVCVCACVHACDIVMQVPISSPYYINKIISAGLVHIGT